eukprot:366501-Chlamydomonas_euryale.AAC.2
MDVPRRYTLESVQRQASSLSFDAATAIMRLRFSVVKFCAMTPAVAMLVLPVFFPLAAGLAARAAASALEL